MISLTGKLSDSNGRLRGNSEVPFLVDRKFVSPSGILGIDRDLEVVEANRAAVKGTPYQAARFLHGEWLDVLHDLANRKKLKPCFLWFDSTAEPKAAFRAVRRTVSLLNEIPGEFVISANFIAARSYPHRFDLDFDEIREVASTSGLMELASSTGWEQPDDAYYYGGTGPNSKTMMMFFTIGRKSRQQDSRTCPSRIFA